MPDAASLQPGLKFASGRFVLIRQLGRGGMGEVWLARDERLREDVALKFLPPEIRWDVVALDDLRRETARSQQLPHPNIIRINDLHEDDGGMAFISMEYVNGTTLHDERVRQPHHVLSWQQLHPLVRQLCEALDYAHREKIIHRDIKPANLMVDRGGQLKLADFGIAAVASDSMSRVSVQHSTSGTLPYMSPQQLMGRKPRVTDDVYAMGATIYELLTSKPPFHSGDLTHQILRELPEAMATRLAMLRIKNPIPGDVHIMVMACLAKEAKDRPQSALEALQWNGRKAVVASQTKALQASLFSGESRKPSANPWTQAPEPAVRRRAHDEAKPPGVLEKFLEIMLGGALTTLAFKIIMFLLFAAIFMVVIFASPGNYGSNSALKDLDSLVGLVWKSSWAISLTLGFLTIALFYRKQNERFWAKLLESFSGRIKFIGSTTLTIAALFLFTTALLDEDETYVESLRLFSSVVLLLVTGSMWIRKSWHAEPANSNAQSEGADADSSGSIQGPLNIWTDHLPNHVTMPLLAAGIAVDWFIGMYLASHGNFVYTLHTIGAQITAVGRFLLKS